MNNTADFKVFQASAGSGKTFTLIKEYLKLCLASKSSVANFKHILAITFTNAAANEMKAKIVKTLREIIDSKTVDPKSMEAILRDELNISDKELKSNAQSLMTCIMHDYSNFCVCTIDAFVQKLSRSFAHDLGLPSKYAVSIDTQEIADTITENLGLRIKDKNDYITQLLIDFSNNQFDNQKSTAIDEQLSEFIVKLTTERAYQKEENNRIVDEPTYKQTQSWLNDKTETFEKAMDDFVKRFRQVESQYGLKTEDYSNKSRGICFYIDKLEKHQYTTGSPLEPTLKGNFNKAIDEQKCLGDTKRKTENDALLTIIVPLKAYFDANLGSYLFYKAQSNLLYLYALRAQIRAEFAQLTEEEEVVHISEFNKLLNSVMGDFSVPFVYERIGEHFRHVFVDEFQDTSILQWQNLLPLIHNGLSSGEMSMVVGDGKQSIYRFRSGEVGQIANLPDIYALPQDERKAVFEQYQNQLRRSYLFENLDTNYRSFENVVNFNNAFFEATYLQLDEKNRKVYVDPKPGSKDGVKIHQENNKKEKGLVQVELYDADKKPDYCFAHVESIIQDLTKKKGYQYSDIALLTRRSEYGSELANYLNNKGIPVISQESILLKSSDKVQLMVNTLRYFLNGDNEAVVANMLYYWKLTQDPGFDGDVSQLFGEVKAIAKGEKAIETVMSLGEAGLLQGALSKATCIFDLCSNLLRIFRFDTIRDAFLNYFMEEVFKTQMGIKEGIADFLSYWDKKNEKHLAVMSVSGNAVKIMTIHKSKGLEFPVVIYPEAIVDLDEKLAKSKTAEEWLCPSDLGFESIPNMEKVLFRLGSDAKLMGKLPAQHVEDEKQSNRLDNLNLLYVAFTRAVQQLYVIAPNKANPNVIRDFLTSKKLEMEVEDGDAAKLYRLGNSGFSNPKAEVKKEAEEQLSDSVSTDWFQKIAVDPDPTQHWRSKSERLQPREWGELVHQVLSKIRTVDDLEAVLLPYLSDGTLDQETADMIRDKYVQMASHPLVGAAFDPTAKIKTECEIFYPQAKTKVIRLDRYAELPDAIYLIDYKTGKKDESHRHQVQTYANALKELTDKEIRSYLVYLAEVGIEVVQV